jgi:hypothetical protein
MKRAIGFLLLLAFLLGSAGCGDPKKDNTVKPGDAPPAPPPGPTKDRMRGGTGTPKGVD